MRSRLKLFRAPDLPMRAVPPKGNRQVQPKSFPTKPTDHDETSFEKEAPPKEVAAADSEAQLTVTPVAKKPIKSSKSEEGNNTDRIHPGLVQESNGSSTRSNEKSKAEETRTTASEEQGERDEAGVDDESNYPKALPLALLTFGLALTTASVRLSLFGTRLILLQFVVALDNTIIATAIPRITTVFDSLNDVGWYGSSYLLTTTSLQPSFGKIYTYFSVKWTYIIAIAIFELGSVICAAATSSTMLIVGRAVAGAGAAALFSGGMNIVGFSVPLRKRAMYIALLSGMFGISSVVGPLLGGAFTDRLSWRWCFWINLPFGGIAIVTVFFFFNPPEREHSNLTLMQKIREIDLLGALFLITAIVCLLLALQWGGSVYPWSDSKVYGCIIGFGLLIICFIVIQFRRGDRATIPPRILLKQRTVLVCAGFSVFLAMGVYTHIFYIPFYFQAVKGTSAEGSGIRTIPYLVAITIASIVVGGSITALGPYAPFMWIGSAIFTIGAGMLMTLEVGSNAGHWIGYQILAAFGAGTSIQIPFIAVQVVLNKKDMPSGNAIAIFFNSLGGAISISIAQNIFSNTLIKKIPLHTQGVDPEVIIHAGATHIREVTPPAQLAGVLLAYNEAVTRALILPIAAGAIAFIWSIFVEWKSVKGKKLIPGGA